MDDSKQDKVNHPSHYTWLKNLCGIEVIDITRHMNFNLGNVIKYILRAGHKSEEGYSETAKEIEDLKKAQWYLNDEIATRTQDMPQPSEHNKLIEEDKNLKKVNVTKEFTLSKKEVLQAAELLTEYPNVGDSIRFTQTTDGTALGTIMTMIMKTKDGDSKSVVSNISDFRGSKM